MQDAPQLLAVPKKPQVPATLKLALGFMGVTGEQAEDMAAKLASIDFGAITGDIQRLVDALPAALEKCSNALADNTAMVRAVHEQQTEILAILKGRNNDGDNAGRTDATGEPGADAAPGG